MTDEQVGELDVLPQVLPDSLLRGTFLLNKIAADLDVRAVDDGKLGSDFLDKWNETGHLRVVCSCCQRGHQGMDERRLPMKATSTPPGASGPPSAVHLSPFFKIQASN